MTRYELIKEYPGSPKKGTIVYTPHKHLKWGGEWIEEMKYKMKNFKNVDNQLFYSRHEIEDWPKYWKLIK